MKSALSKGLIDESFFVPSPADYLARMAKKFIFVDNLLLRFFAVILKRDIIIIPIHKESACAALSRSISFWSSCHSQTRLPASNFASFVLGAHQRWSFRGY